MSSTVPVRFSYTGSLGAVLPLSFSVHSKAVPIAFASSLFVPRFLEQCWFVHSTVSLESTDLAQVLGTLLVYSVLVELFGDGARSADVEEDQEETKIAEDEQLLFDLNVVLKVGDAGSFALERKAGMRTIASIMKSLLVVQEKKYWGFADVLAKPVGIAEVVLLKIAPGQGIPWHFHERMKESEMVLDFDCLERQDQAVDYQNCVKRWDPRECHNYQNNSSSWGVVLCVDQPGFFEDDEVQCERMSLPVNKSNFFINCWKELLLMPSKFCFPGGLNSQQIELEINLESGRVWLDPHAVLVCVHRVIDGVPTVLLVKHRKRGWELPGGKVEVGETPVEASIRELAEEAGVYLGKTKSSSSAGEMMRQVGQYVINDGEHVKSVFAVDATRHEFERPQLLENETSDARYFHIVDLMSGRFGEETISPLMQDLVVWITLRTSLALLEHSPNASK